VHAKYRFIQPYYRFGLEVDSNGELLRVISVSYGERCPEVQIRLPQKHRLIARPSRNSSDRVPPIVLSREFKTEKDMDKELLKGWEISGGKFKIDEAGRQIIDAMMRMKVIEEVP
jgi:hypothetical protein